MSLVAYWSVTALVTAAALFWTGRVEVDDEPRYARIIAFIVVWAAGADAALSLVATALPSRPTAASTSAATITTGPGLTSDAKPICYFQPEISDCPAVCGSCTTFGTSSDQSGAGVCVVGCGAIEK